MDKQKVKSKVKRDGEFVPPDGGWGWMIVVAAGISNLCGLPMLQQFGLLFRDKFSRIGITSAETTAIFNMNLAMTSCVGLANGPMFRKFTFRQVSLAGTIVVSVSLILNTFAYNFATYLFTFSILYGSFYGIVASSNALALNTYWKQRRRLATGLSWTMTGMGPMVWPYLITSLFGYYGETGAILILSGISLHAIACSLLLQPVELHSKPQVFPELADPQEEKLIQNDTNIGHKRESGYFSTKLRDLSAFSSQYIFNEDDPINPGYEITDPGTPMMIRANDGYFSLSRQSKSRISSRDGSARASKVNSKQPSLTNLNELRSRKSSFVYLNESQSKKNSSANLKALGQERPEREKEKERKEPLKPKRKTSILDTLETQIPESEIEDCPTLKAPQDLKEEEKAVVEGIDPEQVKSIADRAEKHLKGNKSSKSLKSFKMEGYGEQYNKNNHSNMSLRNQEDMDEKKYIKDNHSNQSYRTKHRKKANNFAQETEVLKEASLKLEQFLKDNEVFDLENGNFDKKEQEEYNDDDDDDEEEKLTFCEKLTMFFDLDLLKDFTYVNLMLGITLSNFNEVNFSILTPFILGDYGMDKALVAQFMSLLACIDICVRFCVPFVAGKIGWANNTFFLFGVMVMAVGRIVLAYSQHYGVVLLVAFMIGFGKGLRTVFMALVIPSHVPLHKLPGASGLQLLTAGVVYLGLGPVVGWVKDNASSAVTLHALNIFTWLTAASWGLEMYINSRKQKPAETDIIVTK